jgi:hypothetical protein
VTAVPRRTLAQVQRRPNAMRARRGVGSSSIQMRSLRQRGTVEMTNPDQNVASRPS